MTNNTIGKMGNLGNLIYDSGHEPMSGRQRIGTSATEIELLGDIPRSSGTIQADSTKIVADRVRAFDTQIPTASAERQKSPSTLRNGFQSISLHREGPQANLVYQNAHDQQLGSAVDKLLEKYAPDATPLNVLNTSTTRQPTTMNPREEPPKSTFQTSAPSSYTTPNNAGQIPRTHSPSTINNVNQTNRQPRLTSDYDSFQYAMPQPQKQSKIPNPVPMNMKNGTIPQVVPGVLYNLDDDPLLFLLDRQNPPLIQQQTGRSVAPPVQQSSFNTTFQPSHNFPNVQDPVGVMLDNGSQRYSTQPTGSQQLDLGYLIKRIQQDYLREIQPFVSSVKFVEKDHEYGQNLADIEFGTPVAVRRGFRNQADEILRRSFSRQGQGKSAPRTETDARHSPRRYPLNRMDSKQSFTSITSMSTDLTNDDDDDRWEQKVTQVHDRSTSPPPIPKSTQIPQQSADKSSPPAVSINAKSSDENGPVKRPVIPTLAQRIPADSSSDTSNDSSGDSDNEHTTATYNEHEQSTSPSAKPTQSANVITPIVPPIDEVDRRRVNELNLKAQRSEDVHPIPPINRPGQSSQSLPATASTPAIHSDSDIPDGSDSGAASDSDDERTPSGITTTRPNIQQMISSSPLTRPTGTTPVTARGITTTAIDSGRQQTRSAATPNIPFVPVDQRNPTASTNQPSAAPIRSVPTGSARLFSSDANPKASRKRVGKDTSSTIGNRLKSFKNIFHRS